MPTYYNKLTVVDGNSTIREIDLSQDTVSLPSHIVSGYYGHLNTGERVLGTGQGGGTPSATAHTIYFEFEDTTNTTITGYWDSTFISDAIRATVPRTYNNKTVTLAQLDNVTWYSYNPSAIPLNTQLIDFSLCTANSAIDGETGEIIEQEWYYVSDYTRVDHSMTFSYKAGLWTYIGLYDSNKAFVNTIYVYSDGTVDPNDGNLATGTLNGSKIPSNVAYVRLSSTYTTSDEMSLIRTA